ncbi:MAG: choice-of-anchor P family protein, partial [Actinomycetota bacterium]
VSGSVSAPGASFGPLSTAAGPIGLSEVLAVAGLQARAGGTIGAKSTQASSDAGVQGLALVGSLLRAVDISSACTATRTGSTGTVHLDALTIGGTSIAVAPSPNTVLAIAGIAHVVLNEQVPLRVAGGSGLIVRALDVQLLPAASGAAALDVVVAESRCSAAGPPVGLARSATTPAAPQPGRLGGNAAQRAPRPSSPAITSGAPAPTGRAFPAQQAQGAGGPPGAHPSVSVSPPQGVPGTDLAVTVAGYPACARVLISFDHRPLAAVAPDVGGVVADRGLPVPGDADPGRHSVSISCAQGIGPVRLAAFRVESAGLHRSAFVTSLRTPAEVPLGLLAVFLGITGSALALPLVAFPAKLFNSTLRENYAEVRGWFGLPPAPSQNWLGWHPALIFCGFLLVGGALDGLLSPDFGANLSTLALVIGLAASTLVVTFVFRLPHLLYVHQRRNEWGALRVLPGGAVVAAACVLLSRLLHFEPGYLFGLVAGFAFSRPLARDTNGRLTLIASTLLLLVGLLAWVARTPLATAAAKPHAGFFAISAEACLAAVFVNALESLLFCLVPLRFLEGEKLTAWSWAAWAAIFAVSAFCFIEILLQPASGYLTWSSSAAQAIVGAVLFVGFGAISVGFWAYFRFRRAPVSLAVPRQAPVGVAPK